MINKISSCGRITTEVKWPLVKLNEACSLNMGQSPDSSGYNDEGKGLPFYQGNADFGTLTPVTRLFCNNPTKIAHAGDILLSVRAPIGAVNIANQTCCIGRGLAALTAYRDVDVKFLYYAIKSKHGEFNAKGTGSTFKAINKKALYETRIPLPALAEQKNIANILDNVSNLISLCKKQIMQLDLLVKSRFIEMFGDPIKNPKKWNNILLDDFCEVGSSKRIFEKEYVSAGVPFYRTKEVVELAKGNNITTELFISKTRFGEILERFGVPQKNDLLITAVGTIGIIWVVDKTPFYFKDGNLLRITYNKKFNPIYLKFVLEQLLAEHKKQMSAGTAYAALTITDLKKMKLY